MGGGLTRGEWVRAVLMIISALLIVVFGALGLANVQRHSDIAGARTALANCQQIEIIKAEIRGTVEDSKARLPTIAYYRDHPEELAKAITDTEKSVERFKQKDCYELPLVKEVDLQNPNK